LSSGPPDRFPARLGPFHNQCVSRAGTAREIISAASAQELRALLDYANRFHHDTNGAYATELINNAELTSFTGRTLAFIRRPLAPGDQAEPFWVCLLEIGANGLYGRDIDNELIKLSLAPLLASFCLPRFLRLNCFLFPNPLRSCARFSCLFALCFTGCTNLRLASRFFCQRLQTIV
jgi:hypothetical protein